MPPPAHPRPGTWRCGTGSSPPWVCRGDVRPGPGLVLRPQRAWPGCGAGAGLDDADRATSGRSAPGRPTRRRGHRPHPARIALGLPRRDPAWCSSWPRHGAARGPKTEWPARLDVIVPETPAAAVARRGDHDRGAGSRSAPQRAHRLSCWSRYRPRHGAAVRPRGAPDLALTQILVETVTLVAFALVPCGASPRGSASTAGWQIGFAP